MSNRLTLIPEYIDIVQQPSTDFYASGSNLLDAFNVYLGELDTSISFEKAKASKDVIESTSKLYEALNSSNFGVTLSGIKYEFDNIFKLFYIEKFQTLTSDVKALLTKSFESDNIYFKNYSDDIGSLVINTNLQDDSTSHILDTFSEATDTQPNSVPGSVYNKISRNELITSTQLTVYTSALMRRNLAGLIDPAYTLSNSRINTTSHGSNLVTDNYHPSRQSDMKESIESDIKGIIGNMYDIVQFFKKVNFKDQDSDRKAIFLKYETDIEKTKVKIDILKNKLDKSLPNTLAVAPSGQDTEVIRPDTAIDTQIG